MGKLHPSITRWNASASKFKRPSSIVRQWSDELMVGKVAKITTVGVDARPCALVQVTRNEYNNLFHMFFPSVTNFWSFDDPKNIENPCKLGDQVLIRKLPEDSAVYKVTHRVERRLFEHGNLIDPVTKKRFFGDEFAEMRQTRKRIVDEVIGKRLTARQLAAYKLKASRGVSQQEIEGERSPSGGYEAEEKIG